MAGNVNEILIHGRHLAGPFLIALDLLGTFVFALSGAAAGVKSKFDLFGLMVLAFAAGNAGGITRDLLIGAVPPAAISDWRYLAVSLLAGVAIFFWYPNIDVRRRPVLLFDAAGLALFAVTGTQKALAAGLNPVMAALMGMLTGIGGGMLRDVLVNETPTVLRADLYAVAALAAGVVVVVGHVLHYPSFGFMIAGALLCFWLRVMAIFRGWHLPLAGVRTQPG
ncbi:MAG: trimeric intracellular cation channel family protein [Alloacidobacterium sp.]